MPTIITFLNDKGLKTDAVYRWGDQVYSGGVFCLALREFVPHDRMLVCNTPEAEKITWPHIAALNDPRIEPVSIPKGESAAELWDLFDKIAGRIHEDETVVFDITHGLRSLPFLVFLFAAYLKSAKRVKIDAIYYGAYELADFKNGKPAPVIDLSEFVTMLDWLTATDQFVQTGNARMLSGLLNPKKLQHGTLFDAASILDTISQAARLCQPFTLMQEVGGLERALTNAQRELQISAPPFGVLRNQIVGAYAQFQNDSRDVAEMLRTEFHLVEWYYQKGQTIQAITLAREWLIDAVTYRLGQPLDFLIDHRKPFEDAIAGVALIGKQHPQERDRVFTENDLNRFGLELLKWPEIEALKQLWTDLKNVRNPLDHAEHQRKKDKEKTLGALNKLQAKIEEKVMPPLRALAQQWGLA